MSMILQKDGKNGIEMIAEDARNGVKSGQIFKDNWDLSVFAHDGRFWSKIRMFMTILVVVVKDNGYKYRPEAKKNPFGR